MGSRGPLPKSRKLTAKTGRGVKLTQLPAEADDIFKRLAADITGLTPADVALIENTAQWVAIAKAAYEQMLGGEPKPTSEQLERQEAETIVALTVTDSAHGNRAEPRKNPLLIVMRTASEQIRANVRELGATPMARARMPEVEADDLDIAGELFAEVDKKLGVGR